MPNFKCGELCRVNITAAQLVTDITLQHFASRLILLELILKLFAALGRTGRLNSCFLNALESFTLGSSPEYLGFKQGSRNIWCAGFNRSPGNWTITLSTNNLNSKALIEAALFAAGKALSLKDLSRLSGLSEENTRTLAEELVRDYSLRDSGIEIRGFEDRYVMQVRAALARDVISVAPKEIDAPLIRTLAIIAYKQPLKQSNLAEIRGNKSYSHVKELEQMGLISAKKTGRTKVLTTTKGFAEYFGLGSDSPEFVRGAVMRSSRPLGVTRMYESLAVRLGLDYVVVNPYKPEAEDLKLLKDLRILVAAPGYAVRIREHYSGELIEAGVRTFSLLKESAEKICLNRGQGKIEELATEIDGFLKDYRERAKSAMAVKPLTSMVEDMARDLRIPSQDDGVTAASDYANLNASIIVPTHQSYDLDIVERIRQRYEVLLAGLSRDQLS